MYDASAALSPGRSATWPLTTVTRLRVWARERFQHPSAPAAPTNNDAQVSSDAATLDDGANAPQRVRWITPDEPVWLFALRTFGLTLATFGVYAFWARVEHRARLVNAIELDGKRMSYHGRGLEGFVSFLIAAAFTVVIVSVMLSFIQSQQIDAGALAIGSFRWQRLWITLPLLFLVGSVTYRKRHHILRRIEWNGERFKLTGQAWFYAWHHFWTAFLVPLTMGMAAPWRAMQLERRKTNEMAHGDLRFTYVGERRPVYKAFAAIWLVGGLTYLATILTLAFVVGPEIVKAIETRKLLPLLAPGVLPRAALIIVTGLIPFLMVVAVYRAVWVRHQFTAIGVKGGRVQLDMPVWRFALWTFGGTFARIVTLGAAGPVVDEKLMRLIVENMRIERGAVLQSPEVAKV